MKINKVMTLVNQYNTNTRKRKNNNNKNSQKKKGGEKALGDTVFEYDIKARQSNAMKQ